MQNRRTFVWNTAGWSVGAALVGMPSTSRGYFANEAVHVGIIGYGGRCRRLVEALKRIPGVRFTGICDVWDVQLEAGRKLLDSSALVTKDHRELLDRSDVDAVVIATPDHWHVPITIDTCNAGKDVYVEKPLTHDLSEGPDVIESQNRNQRVVQVGTQQRSMPHLEEARDILRSGELGTIRKCHLTWNRNVTRGQVRHNVDPASVDWKRFLGNAPDQAFDPFRFREWRWFWDFGGGVFTDLMVHWMDVVNWYLDLGAPASAASIGDRFFPDSPWETPDTAQTLVHYPKAGVQVYFEATFLNHRNRAMTEFMGTEATLYIDRGRYEVHPEKPDGAYREKVVGTGNRGLDFYDKPDGELLHLSNWIECIRSRATPRCPAEVGVEAVYASHLANASLRTGNVARWQDIVK